MDCVEFRWQEGSWLPAIKRSKLLVFLAEEQYGTEVSSYWGLAILFTVCGKDLVFLCGFFAGFKEFCDSYVLDMGKGNKGKSKNNLNHHRGAVASAAKQKNPSLKENPRPGNLIPTDIAAADVSPTILKGQPPEPKSVADISLPEGGCVDSPSCSRTLGDSDTWSASTPFLESPQSTAADLKKATPLQNQTTAGGKSKRPSPGLGEPSQRIKLQKIDFEEECYIVNPDDLDDISTSLGHVLLGFVAGKYPGRKAIRDTCNEWGVKYQLHFQINEWIVVRFQSKEDRERVLHNGPYKVFRTLLVLRPLPRLFNFKKREAHKAPVWVRLPGLPYDLWNEKGLSNVASRLGLPLHSDANTCAKSKLSFARILVEVDVLKDLHNTVQICAPEGEEFEQVVIYESVPKFCSLCSSIGHGTAHCPSLKSAGKASKTDASHKVNSEKVGQSADKAVYRPKTVAPKDPSGNSDHPEGNVGMLGIEGKKKGVHTRFAEDSSGNVVAIPASPANLDPLKDFPPLGNSAKYYPPPEKNGSSSSNSDSDSCKTSSTPSTGQMISSKVETNAGCDSSSSVRSSVGKVKGSFEGKSVSSTSTPPADCCDRRNANVQASISSQEEEAGTGKKPTLYSSSGNSLVEELERLENKWELQNQEYEKASKDPSFPQWRLNKLGDDCIRTSKQISSVKRSLYSRPRGKRGSQ